MADATKVSPSPTPITRGHSRRVATSRPGSATCAATKAKWPPSRGSTACTAATRSPRYSLAMSCGTTSVSVSEANTTPWFWSWERRSV